MATPTPTVTDIFVAKLLDSFGNASRYSEEVQLRVDQHDLADTRLNLTLVRLHDIFGAPTGKVRLSLLVLTPPKKHLTAKWVAGTATRIGMTDCGKPRQDRLVWSVTGRLAVTAGIPAKEQSA